MRPALPARGLVALLTALIASLGDTAHVVSGTTRYLWSPTPAAFRASWWFLALVVVGGVTATFIYDLIDRRAHGRLTRVDASAAALTVIGTAALYAFSAVLIDAPLYAATLLLFGVAALIVLAVRPRPAALVLALVMAVAGTSVEIATVAAGANAYASSIDALAGVPPWLPALHFSFGLSVATIMARSRSR